MSGLERSELSLPGADEKSSQECLNSRCDRCWRHTCKCCTAHPLALKLNFCEGKEGKEGKGREGKGREEGTSYCITITILTYDNTYKHVFYLIFFAHAHIYRYFICTYCIPKEALQPTWNKLQLDPKPTLKKNFEPTLETPWIKPKLKELHSQPQVNLKPTWNKS